MTDKPRFPYHDAMSVAETIYCTISPFCERISIAGSLRRGKKTVGDIEILYVPKFYDARDGLFDTMKVNMVDECLNGLVYKGMIAPRKSKLGSEVWGEKNKLAIHLPSGIPVDFFSTKTPFWFNYLVCRTGGSKSNIEIATAAKRKGLIWHPYTAGFEVVGTTEVLDVDSEEDVFRIAGLPYLKPQFRK